MLVKRFEDANEQRQTIRMSYLDATHLSDEQKKTLESRYAPHERETRLFGTPMQGAGAVFTMPADFVVHHLRAADVPRHWPFLWAVDFSHGGMSAQAHPAGFVLCAHDRDTDTIYVLDAYKIRGSVAEQCARVRRSPFSGVPVTYGSDASQGVAGTAGTIGSVYRKEGLRMLPKHATFVDGSISLEAGVLEMDERFRSGRLKIASHLADLLEEYRHYHRDENNKIVKDNDDILSGLRFCIMQIRSAKLFSECAETDGGQWNSSYSKDARGRQHYALGTESSYFGID